MEQTADKRFIMRTEKTLNDIPSTTEGDEQNADTLESNEKLAELRERLNAAIESARVAARRLEEKTVAAAKATDRVIREHPYQTVGIAFGVGILIGVLLGRRRD
jgi:ElaB/YqjD/DUF883 family membrane-anchored ribosome-binding protein